MATLNQIKQLTIVGRTEGMSTVRADLDAIAASQQKTATAGNVLAASSDKAAASQSRLGAAAGNTATAHDKASKSLLSMSQAAERQAARLDLSIKAQQAMARETALADKFLRNNVISFQEHSLRLDQAQQKFSAITSATNQHNKALADHTATVGLNRIQMMESLHVMKAFADETIATGQPLRALALEGGRIGEIFAMGSGGVGGTLNAFGGILGRFATGWVGAGVGIAGGLTMAGLAVASFEAQQEKLAKSLDGVGRAAGVTVSGLDRIAGLGARAGGISNASGQDLAAQFASSGEIGANMMAPLIGSVKTYSRVTGQDLSEAGKELAGAFADPVRGAEDLNKKLGFLDDATRQTVRSFQAQGNILQAQSALFEAYNRDLQTATDRTSGWSKAWDGVKNLTSNAWSGFGKNVDRAIFGLSPEENLNRLMGERRSIKETPLSDINGRLIYDRSKLNQNGADIIEAWKKAAAETAKALKAGESQEANKLSIKAGDIVRAVLPEIVHAQNIPEQISTLRSALADPVVMGKLGVSQKQLIQAGGNLSVMQAFNDPEKQIERMSQDAELSTKAIEATTLAERAATEARRAELAVLRETGDVARAAVAAESARNQEIAKANKAADETLQKAKQNARLVGLSPYERGLAEIRNKYSDLQDKNVSSKSEISEAWKPITADLNAGAAAVARFSAALDGATARMGGGNPYGGLPSKATFGSGEIADYIRQGATIRGMDPNYALRVFGAESKLNPAIVGDHGTSFGVAQLHYGGGLGDEFTKKTGLHASDASTWPQQIDFSLDQAKKLGWTPWHAAARVGVGKWDGIGQTGPIPELKAGATYKQAEGVETAAYNKEKIEGPFRAANQSIADMNRQTELLRSTFSLSSAELKGASEAEKLRTQYLHDGVMSETTSAETLKLLNANIDAVGKGAAAAAKQLEDAQQQQQRVISSMDAVRSSSADLISSPLKAIAHHQDPGKAFRQSLANLGDHLIDSGVNGASSALFGGQGKPGGGLFGDALGGLLGGKGQNVGTANINAAVVNVGGTGLGGLLGGGSNFAGQAAGAMGPFPESSGGGLFGWLGSLFKFADGGIMTSRGPLPLRRYADGGVASSPQLAMYGEGSGDEAYVPLKNGAIPVAIRQARQQAANQNISSVSARGGDVIVQGNTTPDMLGQIKDYVDQKHAELQGTVQRNMGPMWSAYQKRYGS
jgi:hypothetical protein